jgi:hypothetical protein
MTTEAPEVTGFDRKPVDSFGKRLVGFEFNPSGDPKVAQLKALFAEIIDITHDGMEASPDEGPEQFIWREAIMRSLDAQMWCVKAVTWRRK